MPENPALHATFPGTDAQGAARGGVGSAVGSENKDW